MSSLPITPPSKARVDLTPKSASPPTGSPGIGDFAALLSQTTARTAPAEGQQTRPARTERRRDDDAAQAGRAEAKDDNKPSGAPAQQADAPITPATDAQPSTSSDGQQAAGQDATAQDQTAAGQPVGPQPGAAPTPAVPAPALAPPAQSAPATGADGDPAGATTGEHATLASVVGQAADAAGQPVVTDGALPADGTPAGQLQIPAELLAGKATGKAPHGKDIKNADGAPGGLPPLPTLPPSAGAVAGAPGSASGAAGDAGANTPNNGAQPQAQPPATAPAVAAGPVSAGATPLAATPTASPLTRASLAQTAERVQDLVRIATTRAGNARATLQLKPEALGQVDVQLRTTRVGLVATIAAHDKAGLDALQNAVAELRRTLQDRGVELHSLDLQLSAGADSGFANQGDAREASTGRGGRVASYGLGEDGTDAADEAELTITRPASIPAGELVDVTA